MYEYLISCLRKHRKKTISLEELESLVTGETSYREFSESVSRLVDDGVLLEKSPEKNNGKEIPLCYRYGIDRHALLKDHREGILECRLGLESDISLEAYYGLSESTWKRDIPHIEKIDGYISKMGFPQVTATSQERSFQLVGDEKWIDEKGGKAVLERLGIWEKLKIECSPDPLMIGVNADVFSKDINLHLVVENKATFMALLDGLRDTGYASLIFGAGWKIVSNIDMLSIQLGTGGIDRIYYFGDLDSEGISIWSALSEKADVELGTDFYRALLNKSSSIGKENQKRNPEAIERFVECFSEQESEEILRILDSGRYIPQEALSKDELLEIWRDSNWK
ncbi:hypothetical protein EUAN_02380 [Andreesenia angusta]|uniref:Wadjet protein JetD C-terminal domain-containing protein n=1 Tax=Andreesenia angusta TaxID=39480 RepID=A0A1S1VA44_9FIRM|nr:Wadjet anti-phage system protein JetD domain-containing protein [Andreesenia angusta]OHW63374.1 hypothetical protein EUAN_02380 [Andreesenia angusta]